jgi:glutamate dehydrogenase
MRELGLPPDQAVASVQGFGNVAQHAVRLFEQIGGKVTCVSCWDQKDQTSHAYKKESGIDSLALSGITDRYGGIDKDQAKKMGYEVIPGDAWLAQDVDILIPAALENQITAENTSRLSSRVKIIAEGANGPTSPEADRLLTERGIFIIPDILANAGGVACSYYEQVQSNMNYYWEKDEVLGKLDVKITSSFLSVREFSAKKKISMRDGAFALAVTRVAQACQDRGWL